jgi:hypothetical protein
MLWCIIQPNDLVFNGNMWHKIRLKGTIWERFIDYSKLEWQHILLWIKMPKRCM